MCVERGTARGLVFFGCQRGFQLCVFLCPIALALVKSVVYSAPAGVAGKCLLLVSCSRAPLGLNALERRDCVHVGPKPRLSPALTKMLVGYMEVTRRLG